MYVCVCVCVCVCILCDCVCVCVCVGGNVPGALPSVDKGGREQLGGGSEAPDGRVRRGASAPRTAFQRWYQSPAV